MKHGTVQSHCVFVKISLFLCDCSHVELVSQSSETTESRQIQTHDLLIRRIKSHIYRHSIQFNVHEQKQKLSNYLVRTLLVAL